MEPEHILELRGVTKSYPGVVALDNVSLGFARGSVHAIVGENGAGKSTFIKVITGAVQPEQGDLFFEGSLVEHNSPEKAIEMGVSAIYQEFNLFPYLSVAENVFANRYETKAGLIRFRQLEKQCREVMDRLGVDIDPRAPVRSLSVGYQQLVEIAKSLTRNVKVLIMDEPSAALTESELERVFSIVERLRSDGVTVIYISHRLDEIFRICETVSVFRDGHHISTVPVQETSRSELIRLMVNRPLKDTFPSIPPRSGEPVLEARELTTHLLKGVSFTAHKGERLGFAGLIGAGRSEVARAIFGADELTEGEIRLHGNKLRITHPSDAIGYGIALIPEDRKKEGVLLHMSVADNVSSVKLNDFGGFGGYLREAEMRAAVEEYVEELRIKTPTVDQLAKNLSGGNQQKTVLAKWLLMSCEVIIFDEPTRGIDVGAKQEIYKLINDLAMGGKTVIIISSELPELLGMSDRIIVMAEGRITAELDRSEATQERIMELSAL
jgi:ribose transport system ATP-binding protein